MNISIVIPTYNRASVIRRAIVSALKQMQRGDELIVVDDGSTDNTKQTLMPLMNKIKYICCKKNSGAGVARNIGIKEAGGDLIAFLDSDDEWIDRKLDLQRALFKNYPDLFYTFSNFSVRKRNGSIFKSYLKQWHQDKRSWDEILGKGKYYSSINPLPEKTDDFKVYFGNLYYNMAKSPYISTITLIVRNLGAGKDWFFDKDLPIYEDWGCYGRIAGLGLGAYMDIDLSWNHDHKGFRLTSHTSTPEKYRARMNVLDRVWGHNQLFLEKHKTYYLSIIKRVQIMSLIESLKEGEIQEARNLIQSLYQKRVLMLLLLMHMPGFIVRIEHSAYLKIIRLWER